MKGLLDFIKGLFDSLRDVEVIDICRVAALFVCALNFIFLVIVTIVILFIVFGSFLHGGVEDIVRWLNEELGDVHFKVLFLSLVVHIVTKDFYKQALKYTKEID
jgi:uncharacterized membrane protein HdeD (DUF308 family)